MLCVPPCDRLLDPVDRDRRVGDGDGFGLDAPLVVRAGLAVQPERSHRPPDEPGDREHVAVELAVELVGADAAGAAALGGRAARLDVADFRTQEGRQPELGGAGVPERPVVGRAVGHRTAREQSLVVVGGEPGPAREDEPHRRGRPRAWRGLGVVRPLNQQERRRRSRHVHHDRADRANDEQARDLDARARRIRCWRLDDALDDQDASRLTAGFGEDVRVHLGLAGPGRPERQRRVALGIGLGGADHGRVEHELHGRARREVAHQHALRRRVRRASDPGERHHRHDLPPRRHPRCRSSRMPDHCDVTAPSHCTSSSSISKTSVEFGGMTPLRLVP